MNELTLEWLEAGRNHTYKIYEQQPSKNPGTVRIGRDPAQCDIVLSHPTVSRLHVEIFFHPQQRRFYLRNLRMSNSLVLDGQQLQQEEVELRPNSTIGLGEMQLKVVAISVDVTPTQPPPRPVNPTTEGQDKLHHKGEQPILPPATPVRSHRLTDPTSKSKFLKTASSIASTKIVPGAVAYIVVRVLGPLLPLALTIWFWRGNVFPSNLQRQQIALRISGGIFALELVLSFFFGWGWGGCWWINLIGIMVIVATLPSENGRILLDTSIIPWAKFQR